MKPRTALVLGIIAVIGVFTFPPAGLALGIFALVQGIRVVRRTRPQPQELLTPAGVPVTVDVAQPGRATAITALVLAIVATALAALVVVVLVVLWPQVRAYSDCRGDANTVQGSSQCEQQFKDAVRHRFGE